MKNNNYDDFGTDANGLTYTQDDKNLTSSINNQSTVDIFNIGKKESIEDLDEILAMNDFFDQTGNQYSNLASQGINLKKRKGAVK